MCASVFASTQWQNAGEPLCPCSHPDRKLLLSSAEYFPLLDDGETNALTNTPTAETSRSTKSSRPTIIKVLRFRLRCAPVAPTCASAPSAAPVKRATARPRHSALRMELTRKSARRVHNVAESEG